MKKNIAVVDCFVCEPVIHCYNNLVHNFNESKLTYHATNLLSTKSLEALSSIDGMIILGSASHVTNPLPWHNELAEFAVNLLKKQIPVLGICFGHQLICHKLGCKVDFHTKDQKSFMGHREVSVTKDAFGIKKNQKYDLIVAHKQTVQSLTKDFESIGVSDISENDFVIHKKYPFLGVQPHPEATDFFILSDKLTILPDEKIRIQRDGMNLIKSFFKHFGIE